MSAYIKFACCAGHLVELKTTLHFLHHRGAIAELPTSSGSGSGSGFGWNGVSSTLPFEVTAFTHPAGQVVV